jgi:hypothetical protein
MPRDDRDLYQRFEAAVRTPKRRLLLDAFLPPPEAIESAVKPPPAPAPAEIPPEEAGLYRLRDEDDEPPPPPKARPKRRAAPAKKKESPKTLEEEIAEFMKRDHPGLDPNLDPEPDPKK